MRFVPMSDKVRHGDENNAVGGYGERYNRLSYTDDYLEPIETGDSE